MRVNEDMDINGRLTRREKECLTLAADGLSAKEIALSLAIAPRTVERHLDQVRVKLHARNRAHMVTQAWRGGVIDLARPAAASERFLMA